MKATTANLSVSDTGVLFVRKLFLREMEAIRLRQPTKKWMPLDEKVELPAQAANRGQTALCQVARTDNSSARKAMPTGNPGEVKVNF